MDHWKAPGPWPQKLPEASAAALVERGGGADRTGVAQYSLHHEVLGFASLLSKALLLAVAENNVSVVKTSLEQKADPDARMAEDGTSALHLAVRGGCIEVLHRLLGAGASAAEVDRKGLTPLAVAVSLGDSRCAMALLLDGGVDVWHTLGLSERLLTQTISVVLSGMTDSPGPDELMVLRDLLLKVKRDGGGASDWLGIQSSPDHAVSEEMYTRFLFLCIAKGWVGGVVALLEVCVDPNSTDAKSRRTALEFATAVVDHRCAAALRAKGALSVANPGHTEWAVLMAAATGSRRALDHWIGTGDPDWREPGGDRCTALMYAAGEGDWHAARKLVLEAGADPALRDARDRTAEDIARVRGHQRLADWLRRVAREGKGERAKADARMESYSEEKAEKISKESARPKETKQQGDSQDIHELASGAARPTLTDPAAAQTGIFAGLESLLFQESPKPPPQRSPQRRRPHRGQHDEVTLDGAERITAEVNHMSVGPNVDPTAFQLKILAVRNLPTNWAQSMDPVVKIRLAEAGSRMLGPIVAQTQTIRDVRQPTVEWNEMLPDIHVQGDEQVICTVWDENRVKGGVLQGMGVPDDVFGDTLIGRIVIPLGRYASRLLQGEHFRISQRMMMQEAEHGESELTVEFGFRPRGGEGADAGWVGDVFDQHLQDDYTDFF